MLRLFCAPRSTNVERVALALAYKGLEVEREWIDYADRSPVIAVSGQGLVPVLVDDDVVVADSLRILRHLEHRFPDPPLFPREPAAAARVELFLEWFDGVWKGPPNAIAAELERAHPDSATIAAGRARMRGWLELFERLLAGGEYLLGPFGAADCAAFPFLKYARGAEPDDDELFHAVLGRELALDGGFPRLAAWIERMDARPRA